MQIKFLGKSHTLSLSENDDIKTLGDLKKKIKEVFPSCGEVLNDKLFLFCNKAKIAAADESTLEEVKITDDAVVFVVLIKDKQEKSEDKKQEKKQMPVNGQHVPNMPGGNMGMSGGVGNMGMPGGMGNMGMPGGMGMPGMDGKALDMILNDPAALDKALEFATAAMPPEQAAMMKSMAAEIKKNPGALKEMMQGMGGNQMMNQMNSRMAQMSPNNPAMNSPYMNPMASPYMASPYMNNPYMMNPYMMNPYMMNPYMQGQPSNSPAPANGPCSHGFYPLKEVNGEKVQQTAEEVYADKLEVLASMGFSDKEANLTALKQAKGDISLAIEILTKSLD